MGLFANHVTNNPSVYHQYLLISLTISILLMPNLFKKESPYTPMLLFGIKRFDTVYLQPLLLPWMILWIDTHNNKSMIIIVKKDKVGT